MVLTLGVPTEPTFASIKPLIPRILSYVLSFVYVGIYWNNHHHMFQVARRISGAVLWANLHLLFWLSMLPFATAWMGENHYAPLPSAAYGFVLLMAAIAYAILQSRIIAVEGSESPLKAALGSDWKGKISPILYLIAIAWSFWMPVLPQALYLVVALLWLVPDRRLERAVRASETSG